jgi:glutathione S-transferase
MISGSTGTTANGTVAGVGARLYVILGSHAARTGILLMDHKGIDYELKALPPGAQRTLRLRGFPGGTVPALDWDGRKVQTSIEIARFLDEVRPDPPLFPADPARRARIEEIERWVDEVFQMDSRRLLFAGGLDWPGELADCGDDGRMGPLLSRTRRGRRFALRLGTAVFKVNRDAERRLLDRLPEQLDRIDGWIEEGVLNGDELNAADYWVAAHVGVLTYRADLRPEIERRPVGRLVDRVLPEP